MTKTTEKGKIIINKKFQNSLVTSEGAKEVWEKRGVGRIYLR